MVSPAPGLALSTPYGKRGANWTACGYHTGADFAGPLGHRLVAAIPGQIRHRNYGRAFGNHQFAISPDPGQPFANGEVFYAHTRTRLPDGTRVQAGQFVAELGNEGNSTGPHLHFELHTVKQRWACGVIVNPQPAIDWQPPSPVGGPYVTEHIYTSKLGYGQRDSDTVKELQERLNRVKLTGGQALPITGNYLAETDEEVRLWQRQVCGDTPDPPLKSYLGPRQRARMFPSPPYTIHDDGLPAIARPNDPPPAGMHGVDISSHQQGIDITKIPADFVVVKATEGVTYTSPTLVEQYQAAKAAGRLLGLYHFARPDNNDGAEEADHFAATCEALGAIGEAVLVLDWERELDNTAWAREFVDRLIMVTGVVPVIYMSESVTRRADWSEFGGCPLWVAKHSRTEPSVSWPTPWALWQWTNDWRTPGYAGPLDHNVSRVDAAQWREWATPMIVDPPPDTVTRGEFDALADKVNVLSTKVDALAARMDAQYAALTARITAQRDTTSRALAEAAQTVKGGAT